MPPNAAKINPRNFFLNEQHELARGEKPGGGRVPEFVGINWATKSQKLSSSLSRVRENITRSRDPLRSSRYFVLARPTTHLAKKSEDKRKAEDGKLSVTVSYSEDDSLVFGRLGLDLIQVNPDGSATVHARSDQFERLAHSSEMLEQFGKREQARWATLDSFDLVPSDFRIDRTWLDELKPKTAVDTIIELQPLLTTVETDHVARAIAEMLRREEGEALRGIGTDFSGRKWLRGKIFKESLIQLAKVFFSIQSIHAPLFAVFQNTPPASPRVARSAAPAPVIDARALPCVAIVDTGVPVDHVRLGAYRRGQFLAPESVGSAAGSHGSFVASRVVFGELDYSAGVPTANPIGECSFYDVNIAESDRRTHEKSVLPALEAVVGAAPDIRVFNLSFDNLRPLDSEEPTARREKLLLVQDLDNFIFARDVLVVVAAGNSPIGTPPSTRYPRHYDDPAWALGTWPRCFNALTCGAFVNQLHADGVAQEIGAPSPFTKVGPGLCVSPKPDFSEPGGNSNQNYRFQPGIGVWGCTAAGAWEDWSGTSFAAPLLARQAAFVLRRLQTFCEQDTRPFGATAKAYLTLSATQQSLSAPLKDLAERTLGKGRVSAEWLRKPKANTALLLWQGALDGPSDLIRVQMPIPRAWLKEAKKPRLRIVLAWDTPVNAAVEDVWASRKVSMQLRVHLGSKALTGSRTGHRTYPLIERLYDLTNLPDNVVPTDDLWILEFSYQQVAEYYPAIDFSPQQRLAFAAELYDDGEYPVSPQPMIQALPVAATMNRFSLATNVIRNPIVLKARI